MFRPEFVDHLVFRIADIDRTERFYTALLGPPLKGEDFIMYLVGSTRLFFTNSTESMRGAYNKEKVGLNHLAFGVRTSSELQDVQAQLNSAGISHSGIKLWQDGVTQYIWLDDPDGMRIEFWLRSE